MDVQRLLKKFRAEVRREHVYSVKSPSSTVVKLNQNESPYDLPEHLKEEALKRALARPWNRYPTDYADRLVHALAEHLGHSSDSILLSNGSNDLIHSVMLAIVGPGTPVVLPTPMFSLYEKAARLSGAELTTVGLQPDLRLDAQALIDASVECDAVLTVITTPNSPTGIAEDLSTVERVAGAIQGFLVVDEAYHEFVTGPHADSLVQQQPNVIVIRTLSKALGLAGLRLGYLIAHPDVVHEIKRVRLPFVINHLSESAALVALENHDMLLAKLHEMTAERARLTALLSGLNNVTVVESATNFLIFKTPLASADLVGRLAEKGVLIRDVGSYPMLAGYVRVTIGTPSENHVFWTALKSAL